MSPQILRVLRSSVPLVLLSTLLALMGGRALLPQLANALGSPAGTALAQAGTNIAIYLPYLSQPGTSAPPPASVPTATPTATPTPTSAPGTVPVYTYQKLATYPHDPTAFTEGLVWQYGQLYESTGLSGQSTVRKVDLTTGQVQQSVSIGSQYFGEGIAVYGTTLVELTWKSNVGFVYDDTNLSTTGQFSYSTEGWGITYDGQSLIMSDGTPTLHFLDPVTFAQTRTVSVTKNGAPVKNLNELEYINGEVYANVWLTDTIVRINPQSGQVTGEIDLTGLRPPQTITNPDAVLNGIAYDAANARLFVTGKLWDSLYQIKLVPKP